MRQITDSAIHLLNYLGRLYNRLLKEAYRFLRRYGLTPTQLDVIALLSTDEGMTQQELSRRLLTTKGNITGLIGRMERCGLVERRVDASDRRRYQLFLTQKSRLLLEGIIPEYRKQIMNLLSNLSAEERAFLQSLLKRLEQNLPQSSMGEAS